MLTWRINISFLILEHRSQSEENIHIRPLTAEERTILRRYDVNVRVAETGSDSDHVTTVRSLREVLSTRIDQQVTKFDMPHHPTAVLYHVHIKQMTQFHFCVMSVL